MIARQGARLEKAKAVRDATLEANAELHQLRQTVQALRDELEGVRIEKQQAVQAALVRSADEVAQMKETIQALRDALDVMAAENKQLKDQHPDDRAS